MKKVFLTCLLVLLYSTSLVSALDSQWFKNNRQVQTLYVDSPEGLRIRNEPTLKGTKTGILYDRMCVKVMDIGAETTIDGIRSNWIKILIPLETLEQNTDICGWVFGGYLTEAPKPFSTKNWTDADLKRYLSRFPWISGTRSYYNYGADGSYKFGLLESGAGEIGTYTVSAKNMTITITSHFVDEYGEEPDETDVIKIKSIQEDSFELETGGIFYPAFTHNYFWYGISQEKPVLDSFSTPSYNAFFYPFTPNMIKALVEKRKEEGSAFSENFFQNLIKMGVPLPYDEEYMSKYRAYWKKP